MRNGIQIYYSLKMFGNESDKMYLLKFKHNIISYSIYVVMNLFVVLLKYFPSLKRIINQWFILIPNMFCVLQNRVISLSTIIF